MRRSERRAVERTKRRTMPKWLAWIIMALFVFLTGVLLWFGLAIALQCERTVDGSVNVTVQRKLLRWIPVTTQSIPNVINATGEVIRDTTQSGGRRRSNTTERLALTSKDGSQWHSPLYTPSLGTRPKAMAEQINAFIQDTDPSAPSILTTWWMPWLVNLAAVPFLLVSLVSLCALGEVILRFLGFIKDEPQTSGF